MQTLTIGLRTDVDGANTQKEGTRKSVFTFTYLFQRVFANTRNTKTSSVPTHIVQTSNLFLFVLLHFKSANFTGSANKLATLTLLLIFLQFNATGAIPHTGIFRKDSELF